MARNVLSPRTLKNIDNLFVSHFVLRIFQDPLYTARKPKFALVINGEALVGSNVVMLANTLASTVVAVVKSYYWCDITSGCGHLGYSTR